MHQFLTNNRDELILRCKQKVSQRPHHPATPEQLEHGIPLFLDQLIRTLTAEDEGLPAESLRISGAAGGDANALSEIGVSAAVHGKELMELGFTINQVVHAYGDLCQAITDLAFERDTAFPTEEFRTLNRCLDNAIADSVTEFSRLREIDVVGRQSATSNERMGFLVHELRNGLGTANLAVHALEQTHMPISGATGAVLKRSLLALTGLVERALEDVRRSKVVEHPVFDLATFVEDARNTAELDGAARRCKLCVDEVDAALAIRGDRQLLLAALGNLLQNAFKFTHEDTVVSLRVTASARHVRIHVFDHCGGLPKGGAQQMFTPFRQRGTDRSGLGLGLVIARESVEADSGTLNVRNIPGIGCVFSIRLPRQELVADPGSG